MYKGYKMVKGFFDEYSHVDLLFPNRIRENDSTGGKKKSRRGFNDCHMRPYASLNGPVNSLQEMVILCILVETQTSELQILMGTQKRH